MTATQHRDRLDDALSRLPRATPSENFTARTLTALDGRTGTTRATARALAWTGVVMLLMGTLVVLGYGLERQRAADRAYRQQVEELESRYQQLLEEVTSVRREVTTPETRIYLGGDESLDLVLDLGQVQPQADPGRDVRSIRPASLEP